MTTFDQHKNFAISTIVTAPAPPLTGVTLAVAAGEGALFPAAPFNVVVFPANSAPSVANGEIIRVTSKGAGDNWTVLRAQEGTAARSIQVGDRIANSITVKALTDIEAAVNAAGGAVALAAAPVLEPGISGQVRAGRVFAVADFTTLLGLIAPFGLWNLGDLSDISGNGGNLTNKGAVTFGSGIMGTSPGAAIFNGGVTDSLYIHSGIYDMGGYGSWGCWFRTAKKATTQTLISKYKAAQRSWYMEIIGDVVQTGLNLSGVANGALTLVNGVSIVSDDRWHFAFGTYDGATLSLYVDGVLEAQTTGSGPIFPTSTNADLNIGSDSADAVTNASNPTFGRIGQAFVMGDVLSLEQGRMLYAAKVAHTFGAVPLSAKVAVRRRRRGGTIPVAAFSTQPLHLYNFTGGVLTDQGSLAVALTNNNVAVAAPGGDGAQGNAFGFIAGSSQYLSATDTGLPAGTSVRAFGCWFKTVAAAVEGFIGWGTTAGNAGNGLIVNANGTVAYEDSAATVSSTATYNDGQPHLAVAVCDNAAADGLKVKLYIDGKIVASATTLGSITLIGANGLQIGRRALSAANYLTGQIDAPFVAGYAMSADEVAALYALGSQALGVSPKNAGDHVEGMDATSVYLIADGLDSQHLLDLEVAA